MIEPEKSITKYLFWRWEYLRRNKQYIDDYNDVLRSNNGTIDLSPLFNIEQNKDNPSLNTVYTEKLSNSTEK